MFCLLFLIISLVPIIKQYELIVTVPEPMKHRACPELVFFLNDNVYFKTYVLIFSDSMHRPVPTT